MFCLNCDSVLIISLYRAWFYISPARFSSLYREYRYVKDCFIGVLSHTIYCNFCWDIQFSLLYQGYCYIEDHYIGVSLQDEHYSISKTTWLWAKSTAPNPMALTLLQEGGEAKPMMLCSQLLGGHVCSTKDLDRVNWFLRITATIIK